MRRNLKLGLERALTDNTNPSTEETTPIHDNLANPVKQAELKFIEKAAKAVWAFVCAFATALIITIIPHLLEGRMPTEAEWIFGIGMGLAAAYGTGQVVYSVTNKTNG